MLKLMKYEFRKQIWSKGIILFLAAIIELIYFVGIIADKNNWQMTSLGLLVMLSMGAVFFVGIECINTFSNDLKTKCSYMLFLTPHSSFSIVGAKIITGGIQVIVTGLAFLGLFILDGFVLAFRYAKWKDMISVIKEIIDQALQIKVDIIYSDVYSDIAYFLAFLYCTCIFINYFKLYFFGK